VTPLKMGESRAPSERRRCPVGPGCSGLLSRELHLETQVGELVDEALGARGWIEALEGVLAELVLSG
jgi:hypothetical protein